MLIEPLLLLLLVILLLVVGAGALISLILRALFPPRPAARVAAPRLNPDLAYQPRSTVLSDAEQALLEGLARLLPDGDYRVLTQIPLSRLVAPDRTGGTEGVHTEAETVLHRYRLDMVICRASDSRPRCVLVFENTACAREPAVARILSSAGLPLVHLPVQPQYSRQMLEAALNGQVELRVPAQEPPQPENHSEPEPAQAEPAKVEQEMTPAVPQSAEGTPLCPRCYAPMQRQEAENDLWRCSRYPRCSTEISIPSRHSHDAL